MARCLVAPPATTVAAARPGRPGCRGPSPPGRCPGRVGTPRLCRTGHGERHDPRVEVQERVAGDAPADVAPPSPTRSSRVVPVLGWITTAVSLAAMAGTV